MWVSALGTLSYSRPISRKATNNRIAGRNHPPRVVSLFSRTTAMGDFVSIAVIVLLVLLGPLVLVWRTNSRRKRDRFEDQEQWRELDRRTYALEQTVRALQTRQSARGAQEEAREVSELSDPTSSPSL